MKLKAIEVATASTSTTLLRERWCLSRASLRRDRCRLLFSELRKELGDDRVIARARLDRFDAMIAAIANFHVMHFEEVSTS